MNLSKWRSSIFFPTSLSELGDINDPSMDHYDDFSIGALSPAVHWTFLCEVVEYTHVNIAGRPQILCRDSAGKMFNVIGYFEGLGPLRRNEEFDRVIAPRIVAGNVLAIRYAEKKTFMDLTEGIRLEDEHVPYVRTVATSLDNLLTAGDLLVQHCSNPTVACWHCHREKSDDVKLLKCGSCSKRIAGYRAHGARELNERPRNASQAWYCGVDCQRADWGVRHKRECKLMDDLLELTGNGRTPFDLAVFKRRGWMGFRNNLLPMFSIGPITTTSGSSSTGMW